MFLIIIFISATPPVDSCPGNLIDTNSLGLVAPNSTYNMLFTTGSNSLPTITDITVNNVTLASEITIQGTYCWRLKIQIKNGNFSFFHIFKGTSFSANSCENQVFIGGVECSITTASSNRIVCKLDPNSGLSPNIAYNIELAIKNIGYAIKSGTFLISFLPAITSISPNIGNH